MSGSAIKSVNRTNEGSGERAGYASDGIKSSGTKLEKLNLERKFDDPSSNRNVNLGGRRMPVQQALSPGTQGLQQLGVQHNATQLPAKKRVRLGNNTTIAAGGTPHNRAPAASSGAAKVRVAATSKSVSIGGTTSFASSPYQAFTNNSNSATKTNANKSPFSATTNGPKFNMGSASKPTFALRDVRGRNATPGGKMMAQRRTATPGASRGLRGGLLSSSTAGSTPGLAARGGARGSTAGSTPGLAARGGVAAGVARGGLTRTPGGTIAAGRNLSAASLSSVATARTSNTGMPVMRRTTAAASRGPILSRSTGYRRRAINARSFKPMSRLLTGVYTKSDKEQNDGGKKRNQSMMLTESIVSQILTESRNKLGLAGDRNGELALFGGNATRSGDSAMNQARTFEEEAATYKAANKAVPRVRMNRVLGSGQSGGRRFQLEGTSTSVTNYVAPTAVAAATTTAPGPSLLFGKPPAQLMAAAPRRAVTFRSPNNAAAKSDMEMEDVEPSQRPFVPYLAATLAPRGNDDLQLTPCKPQDNVSKEVGEEIERLVKTDEWKREAMSVNYGFDDPNVCTPRKASGNRRKGTPHPKRAAAASAMSTPALLKKADAILAGAAPYSFMPGGAAASSKVDTPMAYKFGKSPESAASKTPKSPGTALKSSPKVAAPVAAAAPAPAAGGWGNIFKSKPGEWKCDTCSTKNPPEAKTKCVSCEAPKAGAGGGSDSAAASGSSGASGAGNGEKASIGAGGFSFGGTPSAAAPASGGGDTKAGIGAGGFSFGGATSSSADPSSSSGGGIGSGGFSLGGGATATPAKEKRGRGEASATGGDGKAGIGAGGFSLGGAAPSSSSGGAFSFGGSTATPANTPAKSKRGRDEDASQAAAPSGGGFNFGASAAPASTAKATSSAGFTFGGGATSSDEKKEEPASNATASTGAFSFGATENKGGGASIPGFAFGAPPSSGNTAATTPATEKTDGASEPSSKKPMFSFGKGTPSLSMPAGNGATPAPAGSLFAFGGGTTPAKPADSAPTPAAAAPLFGAPSFQAPAPAPTVNMNGTGGAPTSQPAFSFGGTPAASKPTDGASMTPAASFGFGASASQAPPASGGSAFAFGVAGGATSSTPAPAQPPATSGSGFGFGAGSSTPAAPSTGFGATPGPAAGGFGFGNASQPAAAPAPTTPGTTFGFGGSSTPAAPSTGFGATPAPATGGFGFGNASQPAAAQTPGTTFGFGGGAAAPNPTPGFAPAATPTPAPGFGGNAAFGTTPSAMGGAPPSAGGGGGAFSIGTGGPKRTPGGKTPGGRRILKARRPPANR